MKLNSNEIFLFNNSLVTLRAFKEDDIVKKVEWVNNPENNTYLHYDIPINSEKTRIWFQNKNNTNRIDLVIEYGKKAVGLIGLLNIDFSNEKAEFYISMGETAYKRKGIATQACNLLLDFAFERLGLHKVYLTTDGENYIAHSLFEKVGFIREGVFLDDLIHKGKYINRIRYGILNRSK